MKPRKIVVGVDGSSGSAAALEWAIDIAGLGAAEIIAVHVADPTAHPAPGAVGASLPSSSRVPRDARSTVAPAHYASLKASGLPYRILDTRGHAATQLMRIADEEEADLIVVGNALRSTMAEIFLGSVAHELTHHARVPLAIVPAHADQDLEAVGRREQAAVKPTRLTRERSWQASSAGSDG
ncbi:MAG: universal stress protein [Candidatus Dormiibacterota bacterium]